jgi:P27 family predicted phage terminase small subunit
MGKRGPAPTPTKVLEMRGSWRAKVNKREPKPAAKRPPCPRWLSPDAKKVWRELTGILMGMGVLTVADRLALARYCDGFVRWRQMAEYMSSNGEVIETENGMERAPQVDIYLKLALMLQRLEDRFGLTPSARTRIMLAVEDQGRPESPTNRWSGLMEA